MKLKPSLKIDNSLPIRVLQVFTILERAGAESMIMNYYRNIDRSKVQFDFLVHRHETGAFDSEIKALGGKIFRLPPITSFRYRNQLEKFVKSQNYIIIHSHIDAYSYWILKSAKKNKIPVRIAHSHSAVQTSLKDLFAGKSNFSQSLKGIAQSYLRYGVRRYATHYFACGQKAGDWLFGNKKDSLTIIKNALPTKKFMFNIEARNQIRLQLGVKENEFVVGHVGRFSEVKNHKFLIQIFEEIKKTNKNFKLILVGGGTLKNEIKSAVETIGLGSCVDFLGIRKDIPQLLQAFDIFLFPSIFEGLPVTMIEAQVSGLPIIASDSITKEVNVTDLVTNVSLQKMPSEWANIIIQKVKNTKRYDRSEEIVESGYDIQANAKKLQDFYLQQIQ